MELFFLSLLLLVTLYSLFSMLKTQPTSGNFRIPPGSTGWPFIGESIEYYLLAKTGCTDKFITDRTKKYSSNLFKTSYLGQNMVFLCSAEGNKFLFSNENKLVKPWVPTVFVDFLLKSEHINLNDALSSAREAAATFSQSISLKNYVGIIDATTKDHLHKYWDSKEQVQVHYLARKFIFALSCQLMLNIQDPETINELNKLVDILSELFLFPINIPGTKCHRTIAAAKEFIQKLGVLIRQRRKEILESKISESVDVLTKMVMEKNEDGEYMSELDIAFKIMALIIAAYDNPSITIVSLFKYLSENPQVYEQVRREQMEIANSRGPEELLTLEDTKKMKYTWNVICEVLRLEPPSPGNFREAMTNINIDGYTIPKGWKLHWTVHASHKNPEYFKDPEKFDPSRFEEHNIIPFSYVPFGGGPHMCPGRNFVRLLLLVFMHHVVQKFKWEMVFPGEKMIRDPNLKPEKGLPVILHPQDGTLN